MRLVTFRDPDGSAQVGELEGEVVRAVAAPTMLAWLAGEGRGRTGAERALAEVELLAPVPEPPSVRDFYSFEGHVAAAWRRRGAEVPPQWYEAPAFYFSNPAAIRGPGEAVERPSRSERLDFELEIAAIVAAGGIIGGFALMNDWSARDLEAKEVTVGLGPQKAKDFATSLGPWLVTPDELPYEGGRLHLEATVAVNGTELSRCSASEQHFPWPRLLEHAARDTRLRPGDVLGSGTLAGGSLVDLGPQDFGDGSRERWIEPGDVVTLAAPGLGSLVSPVV